MKVIPPSATRGGHSIPAGRLGDRTGAFTLIEILLAVGIFAIVLLAINTVFFSAVSLRDRTTAALDEALPANQALARLRRDLQNAQPPGGYLASAFRCGLVGSGMTQGNGLEFFTTTGVIGDDAPWSDVQRVAYLLVDPVDRADTRGKDLVRVVTRNLLATGEEDLETQHLLENVAGLELAAYTGSEWRDTWDTSLGDVGLPSAIRCRLLLAPAERTAPLTPAPMELLVPLVCQARTNQTQTAGGQP